MNKKMKGVAAALQGDESEMRWSIATLSSDSPDNIRLDSHEEISFNPEDDRSAMGAFGKLFETYCEDAVQVFTDVRGRLAQIPLHVQHGVPGDANPELIGNLLKRTFPQWIPTNASPQNIIESNVLLDMVVNKALDDYLKNCPPTQREDGAIPRINGQPATFGAVCDGSSPQGIVPPHRFQQFIDAAVAAFGKGDKGALTLLETVANGDADIYAKAALQSGGIGRFILMPDAKRFEYLDVKAAKDLFVARLNHHIAQSTRRTGVEPHNICVKRMTDDPNDELNKSAPPFVDICATHMADAWDFLKGVTTKKHVQAVLT